MLNKKILALTLATIMAVSATGCASGSADIVINEDYTGTFEAQVGFTEEGLEKIKEFTEIPEDEISEFEKNGVKYYGKTEKVEFENLEELNSLLNAPSKNNSKKDNAGNQDTDTIDVIDKLYSTFVSDNSDKMQVFETGEDALVFEIESSVENIDSNHESIGILDELGIEYDDMTMLSDTMSATMNITFPKDIYQVKGSNVGVEIEKNTLSLDIMKMSENVEEESDILHYVFSTDKDYAPSKEDEIYFTDVVDGEWYYNAVTALANGGLVNGVGNNMFNPNGTLTVAEFAQILARAKGVLNDPTKGDYWAQEAIERCLDAGYIANRGLATAENYSIPITREEAVAAMYLASGKENFSPVHSYTIELIPDGDLISDEYKELIVDAYNYEITTGVDSNRTFNPKGNLKRAEICQLFYNLDWTTARVPVEVEQ